MTSETEIPSLFASERSHSSIAGGIRICVRTMPAGYIKWVYVNRASEKSVALDKKVAILRP
jgi:hypothetical protein